jgi:two-component system nitrate/nitrite response regulator NarL
MQESNALGRVKVYIIDEHAPVRSALAERLGLSTRLEVIGHGGEVEQIMVEVQAGHPDLVLLEVKRKDGMGLELLRKLSRLPGPPRLAVLTSYPTRWEEDAAVRAGAEGYLLKNIDSEELIAKIEDIIEA